ncbi:PotD/PotF family extracellular solute-binding protein [Motilimonas sp. E26]|uniref:ABC transporter substrate-binding protein n=1 Tax=Motilimonas sp. E26 TaxID=2865674 RepID=UPI001E2A3698|nr:PotD/PotF family extracellular solute-binding protein [Motilimonas sp. E26]MCE0557449.1 PotD/PotF family extracellular solute-binding protein [Motilimonas sp. E26]
MQWRNRIVSLFMMLSSTLAAPSFADVVKLNFLEWGYLPIGYEARFQSYAKARGVNVELNSVTPYITDFDSIYGALRTQKADVVMPANFFLKAHHSPLIKLLLPIDNSRLTNFQQLRPIFQQTQYDKEGDQHYAIAHTYALFSLAYDQNQFSQPPTSWSQLNNADNTGQFRVYCDQFEPVLISSMLALGESPALFENGQIIKDHALQERVQNTLTMRLKTAQGFWGNQENNCADLRQQSLATTWGLELVKCNQENNQRWKIAVAEEGPIYSLDTLAIGKHLADQPDKLRAAYLLIDFLISQDQQALVLQGVPTIQGVNRLLNRTFTPEEQAVLPDKALPEFDERLLIPPLSANIKNRYKRMMINALEASDAQNLSKECNWDIH